MGAAINLLVILMFSIFVVRVAAVAFRLTGMLPDPARSQARSGFTCADFTGSEPGAEVNHPNARTAGTLRSRNVPPGGGQNFLGR